MTDEETPSLTAQLSDIKNAVTEGLKAAASSVGETIEEGKKPGNPLDVLAKITREAPLGMLLAAFLLGRASGRRRRW